MKISTQCFRLAVLAIGLLCSFNSFSQTVNVVNSFSGFAGTTSSDVFTLSNVEVLSGIDRLMLVGVSTKDGEVTSITYNNVPLTLVGYLDGNNESTQAPILGGANGAEVYIYSYLNPPIGTADVVVTLNADYKKGIVVGATNFSGVDQTNPFGEFASAVYHDDSEAPFDLYVPSSIGSIIFDVSTVRNGTQTMAAGQTQLYNINSGSETHGGSSTKVATSTSTLMSWSSTDCQEIGRAGIAINPISITSGGSQVTITCDFVATQDTYIKLKEDSNNYGSCELLTIDREKTDLHRALLQFDLSNIPISSTIISSELRLYTEDGNDMTVGVFQIGVADIWDEGSSCDSNGSSNWNKRTSSSNWTTYGVVGPFDGGTPIETINGSADGIHSWPLTSLTQAWFNGTVTNNGVMVGSPDGGGDRTIDYDSRETTTGIPPVLRVTYTIDDIDSDFDGISDSVDIDDDNDGILDIDECNSIVNPPLSNADFEVLDILTLDGGPTDVVPTTGIWKGDASNIPNWLSADATNNYLEIWHNSHTAGNDVGGQAYSGTHWAEVNATTNDGLYQDVVSTPGDVLQWIFAHRKRTGYAGSANEDIVRLLIGNPSGTLTSQGNFSSAGDSSWSLHYGKYTVPAGQTTTRLTFTVLSTASGSTSSGNFIDNVQLFVVPTDCEDTDGDSIPDYFDLDSDNDGIPDIVEAGLSDLSDGKGKIPLSAFTDTNNNGMHDSFEGNTPLDSDGDGTPNYLDLDSDNDAVFDVDEARTQRFMFGTLTFDNGDGDINGDGVGDGDESEAFRVKIIPEGCTELFGDGILDIYDYGNGFNEYGNLDQGSAPYFVNNEDSVDTPDYIDLDSNNDGTFDIEETHYAHLDGDNDGIIDDTNDSDSDGLMDSFDTNDSAFGSPRDLADKFDLFFDGRNDYVEDTNVINGWSEATLMTWIKIDPSATGDQVIFGQNSFYLQLNSDKTISGKANGNTVTNGSAINTNQWTHVATSYSNSNSILKLYINGHEIASTAVSGALPSDSSSLSLGRQPDTNSKYFNGYIDEARVFFKELTINELQKMVYQEIEENGGNTKGSVVPINVENITVLLPWNTLKRYYRMDTYKDDILDDLTTASIDVGSGAKIYNSKIIADQTAPLPFVTQQSGRLDLAINDPVNGINGNDAINNESAIVKISHNDVYVDSSLKQVGLIIDAADAGSNPIEFSVKNDSELNVSWYLELDGKLDLEGESQLVQGDGSILDADSSGYLEKDQQGTANSFNYNYWSSSVGPIGSSGARGTESANNDFSISGILLDGSSADDGVYPKAINFQSSHTAADSGISDPITISTYWLWKYNGSNDNYYAWQNINENTPILAGEGYTMKGSSGSAPILSNQNYVFRGKPYNGDFTLPIAAGDDRLIGNPYPSAIDAEKFIKDNLITTDGGNNTIGNVFNGAVYFWDHFGEENSHNVGDYIGGYASRNLIAGAPAISNDSRINATGDSSAKIPGQYIPVNQGFFVITTLDVALTGITNVDGGDIVFKNSQRVFMPETTSNSVFMRQSANVKKEDNQVSDANARTNSNTENIIESRPIIRLNFDSPNGFHRQIVTGIDENASNDFDLGYDAPIADPGNDDMFWTIENTSFVIQGVNNFNDDQELPLGLTISEQGIARIAIDTLENIGPNVRLYIKDNSNEETYEITNEPFEIELLEGEYYDRFSLVFQSASQTLGEATFEQQKGILIYMNDSNTVLEINRLVDIKIERIKLSNALGQVLNTWDSNLENRRLSLPISNLSTGLYITKLETSDGDIVRKMIIK